MKPIEWVVNTMPGTDDKNLPVMALDEVKKARTFHESFPQYSKTPLVKLEHMAEYLGLDQIYVKDESYRFGLNAFKVLGGSFAIAKYIAGQTGKDVSDLPYSVLTSEELKKEFGQATFFTATDGNHGRGVAWAANRLGQKAVVYTAYEKILDNLFQDTAWDGYEEIPAWIMQGYGTMAMEADEQLEEYGCGRPTHVFIQAGVGSLAGAVQGYFANRYPDNPPKVVVVEADVAACLYKGAKAGDGQIRIVDGDMQTIMAGLACGEPNTISWDILKNHVDTFVSAPDWAAAKGMRMLAAPLKGDTPITSGESGAAPFGVLACIMTMDEYKDLREHLALNKDSKVLLFSTEGDTDPDRYKSIVWEGKER